MNITISKRAKSQAPLSNTHKTNLYEQTRKNQWASVKKSQKLRINTQPLSTDDTCSHCIFSKCLNSTESQSIQSPKCRNDAILYCKLIAQRVINKTNKLPEHDGRDCRIKVISNPRKNNDKNQQNRQKILLNLDSKRNDISLSSFPKKDTYLKSIEKYEDILQTKRCTNVPPSIANSRNTSNHKNMTSVKHQITSKQSPLLLYNQKTLMKTFSSQRKQLTLSNQVRTVESEVKLIHHQAFNIHSSQFQNYNKIIDTVNEQVPHQTTNQFKINDPQIQQSSSEYIRKKIVFSEDLTNKEIQDILYEPLFKVDAQQLTDNKVNTSQKSRKSKSYIINTAKVSHQSDFNSANDGQSFVLQKGLGELFNKAKNLTQSHFTFQQFIHQQNSEQLEQNKHLKGSMINNLYEQPENDFWHNFYQQYTIRDEILQSEKSQNS